jgi:membrane carboxypeptidase/penicillin-binding protein PbpC
MILLNEYLSISQQLLQSGSNITLFVVIVTGVLAAAYFWFLKNQKADSETPNRQISIKIDRNGKHRYEVVPDSGNGNLKFWIKLIIALIALAFLWIPIKSLLNPQY